MSKIPVAVLGATGIVGQRFIEMLADHPWFEIAALVGSDRSAGKKYGEAASWVLAGDPPAGINDMQVLPLSTQIPGRVAFSALPADVAKTIEPQLAAAGFVVCSNASAYRLEPDIPVIIPEVNGDHLQMLASPAQARLERPDRHQPQLHHHRHRHGAGPAAQGLQSQPADGRLLPGGLRRGLSGRALPRHPR